MKQHRLALMLAVALGLLATPAWGRTFIRYYGPHPIDPHVARGMCLIEGPHIHSYKPYRRVLYAHVNGSWAFVGDPTEFDPDDQPKTAYYGAHPLFWITIARHPLYCDISGPHYHAYAPSPNLEFEVKGGINWYVGPLPRAYRHRRVTPISRYYSTIELVHPEFEGTPPTAYVGFYASPGGAGVETTVEVPAPSVHIGVQLPSVGVIVGGRPRAVRHERVIYRERRGPERVIYRRRRVVRHRRYERRGPPPHAPAWGHRGKHGPDHGHKRKSK